MKNVNYRMMCTIYFFALLVSGCSKNGGPNIFDNKESGNDSKVLPSLFTDESQKEIAIQAIHGDAQAQKKVGLYYSNGSGVAQNYEEAMRWYKLAAAQGNADAQLDVGLMYFLGQGVAQSYEESMKWFRLAADQENADAQNIMGTMYFDGQAVAQSHKEAMRWYKLAAAQGNANAQNSIGTMYFNGQGEAQSYEEAMKWFKLAAAQGHADAQRNIGNTYFNGQGVVKSYEEAMKWYKLAAAQGNADAQNSIGAMYFSGQAVIRSYEEAMKWFTLAAAQGNADAQNNVGSLYFNGQAVAQSYEEAIKWYTLAAAQGHTSAKEFLERAKSSAKISELESKKTMDLSRQDKKPEIFTDQMLSEIYSRFAPSAKIIAKENPINSPLLYLLIAKDLPTISDSKREDPFTHKETYDYSFVSCSAKIFMFTPITGRRVLIGKPKDKYTPQTMTFALKSKSKTISFTFWIGGFATENMLSTRVSGNSYNLTSASAKTISSSSTFEKYQTRKLAESSADALCDFSGYKSIEMNSVFAEDGILTEGASESFPFIGNTTIILFD